MRTSSEKVRLSDEAERVQSVSYSHTRSLSGLYNSPPLFMGPPHGILRVNIPHFWWKNYYPII